MRARSLGRWLLGAAVGAAAAQPAQRGVAGWPTPPSPYERDSLYPTPVTIYGLVNAGLSKPDMPPPTRNPDPCAAGQARSGINSVERNHIGVRGVEVLTRAWRAELRIEQSFALDSGALTRPCGVSPDAHATVGFTERDWGRIDFGRVEQTVWQLSLRVDPWSGQGGAGPGWRSYGSPEIGATRYSDAVSYESAPDRALRWSFQLGRPQASSRARRSSVALAWDRLPLLLGAGYQSWPDGSWTLPLVAQYDTGDQRVGSVYSEGRAFGSHFRNLFVGAEMPVMGLGDPYRQLFRMGLNVRRVAAEANTETRLSGGWRYRLNRHAWFGAAAALTRSGQGPVRSVLEASFSYQFERDLRKPQWPR